MSESNQILWIFFWLRFLKVFIDLLSFLFARFLDMECLFAGISVFCSLVLFEDFRSGLSLAVISGNWLSFRGAFESGSRREVFYGVAWSFRFSNEISFEGWTGDSSERTTDPESDSLCQSESKQGSDSESESESASSSEGIPRPSPPLAQKIFDFLL